MADSLNSISPWQPITNKLDLAHLGKLAEELGELSSIVARIIIQGMDERCPTSGILNREALEDEIADVRACLCELEDRFDLDTTRIYERVSVKRSGLVRWHHLIKQE